MKLKNSILKKLRFYMILFGVFMGVVFPIYASFFVEWKEGMQPYFILGCIAAGITVGVVSFTFVRIILLKPLLQVSEVASSLQNKDISGHISIESEDSVGDIISGLNASSNNIRDFLEEINITTCLNYDIIQKVKSEQNLTDSSNNSIHQSIDIVNNAVQTISDHSNQICYSLANSVDSVESWQKRLKKTISHVEMLSISMESLVINSGKITLILDMVQDVARQTNMVAINASIEAASAGQYGKGFAVVAIEIKELANSVSKSAQDIAKYTSTINNDIRNAEQSVKEISTLNVENKESSKELKDNLDKINEVSRLNYKADKNLISSVEKLNQAFTAIEEVLAELSNNTNNLKGILNSYKY